MSSPELIKIPLETARALAVIKQGLDRRPPASDKQTLLDIIHQIGLLQLDTINVVARSHYLVMLSRAGLYDRADLDALLYPDRRLFEQWAHAACLIPVGDYPYFKPVILARRQNPLRPREEILGDNPQEILDEVLNDVKARGPLASRDFADPRDERGSWWGYKPAKHALVILYERGYLMVDRRVKFQIYYDLSERVLPSSVISPTKTVDDQQRWATMQGLSRLGVATAHQVSDYYRLRITRTRSILKDLVDEGSVLPAEVDGWKEQAYVSPNDLHLIEEVEGGGYQPDVTAFLSPFDNLTWNRNRLRDLFGFDYTLEIYVPAAKRQYGYYVLPILHNGRFVGRLDPKADRKTGTMIIRHFYLESDEKMSESLVTGISNALREFMDFHGSQRVVIEHTEPVRMKTALLSAIKEA